MKPILSVSQLSKIHDDSNFQLNQLSFEVQHGTIMGLVGQNGAGKTTTINCILNLIKRDSGVVSFFGMPLTSSNVELRNSIGVVFDSSCFNPNIPPKQLSNVCQNLYANWNANYFTNLLYRFHISPHIKIKNLSKGAMMKLSIAVALSHEAKLLIMDEPTSGLDPVAREDVLDILQEFVENGENAVLLSSHITSDLEKIADEITFIHKGKVILSESKSNLLYEYGLARVKQSELDTIRESDYLMSRKRGQQVNLLVENQRNFSRIYPHIVLDKGNLDEILVMLTKEMPE